MAKKVKGRSSTPATLQLSRAGIDFRIEEYEADGPPATKGTQPSQTGQARDKRGYGVRAADALGLDPAAVFKTLLAELSGGELVVGVVPVSGRLDLRSLAKAAGSKKAVMASPDKVERRTGYVLGGVSPFGQKFHHRTFVDSSAMERAEVHVSGGRRGLELVVAPAAFENVLGARFVPLCS